MGDGEHNRARANYEGATRSLQTGQRQTVEGRHDSLILLLEEPAMHMDSAQAEAGVRRSTTGYFS